MTETTKRFGPIRAEYAFFEQHTTEFTEDLRAYAPHLRELAGGDGPVRMLDFGCGPGNFSARFLTQAGFDPQRLRLALVEPDEGYRTQSTTLLQPFTAYPVEAWPALPSSCRECFDLGLANHVFYYVPDLDGTLTALRRAMSPGAMFLATIAGLGSSLTQIWRRCFELIGKPIPFHTAEDLEAALVRQGIPFRKQEVWFEVAFRDAEDNRLTILRFLLGDYFPQVPRAAMLGFLDPHAAAGRVVIRTFHEQFVLRRA